MRDGAKFDRLADFGAALPDLRRTVRDDLALPGLPRRKVEALVVSLLDRTLIRVGNDEYRRQNGSYGLTTLETDHVEVTGSTIDVLLRRQGRQDPHRQPAGPSTRPRRAVVPRARRT